MKCIKQFMSTNNKYNYKSLVGIGLKYLSKMSAIVQAYNISPSGNCNATDD